MKNTLFLENLATLKLDNVTYIIDEDSNTKIESKETSLLRVAVNIQKLLNYPRNEQVTIAHYVEEEHFYQQVDFFSDDTNMNDIENILFILATHFCDCQDYATDTIMRDFVILNMHRNHCQHVNHNITDKITIHFDWISYEMEFTFYPNGTIRMIFPEADKIIESDSIWFLLDRAYYSMTEWKLW